MKRILLALAAIFALSLSAEFQRALALSRAEARSAHAALAPLAASEEARALGEARFMRLLAGLGDELSMSDELSAIAEAGARLMAANGSLSHAPERPTDMDDASYSKGLLAARESNLAKLNWSGEGALAYAVRLFALDDSGENLSRLGHRRWLLSPRLGFTGIGAALDADGRTYVAMHVVDASVDIDYDMICWPCAGVFPAEYTSLDMPWSISPNPLKYDVAASRPIVILREEVSGAEFRFDFAEEEASAGSYSLVAGGGYGDGPAYVFRPDLGDWRSLAAGYAQNQRWVVSLEGMVTADGEETDAVTYTVDIISLEPIDPADVELSLSASALRPGESARCLATVVPAWADDLMVEYESSDVSVATVDASGVITALGPGVAEITARTYNGRSDAAIIEVASEAEASALP